MNHSILLSLGLLVPSPAGPIVEGDYVEARTCDVYTGPCFANAEVNETGKEATLAWRIRAGTVDGVDLAGLSVAAFVRASNTLGDPYRSAAPSRAILLIDERAGARERAALERFAKSRLGDLAGSIAERRVVAIALAVGCCDDEGCAELTAGDVVSLKTRCVNGDDHVCGNEEVYYPPLTDGVTAVPAVLTDHAVSAVALGVRFQDQGSRGAFAGRFRVAVAEAVERPEIASAARFTETAKYELVENRTGEGDDSTAAPPPDEVPEAFRALLDPSGVRLEQHRGKTLYELWLRKEIPLLETPRSDSQVEFPHFEIGEFVGVLRSHGHEYDYRENPIDKGLYALRYGVQPNDGDHLGTAPSRDFVVLTGFADDKSTNPVGDMDELIELSLLVSSHDHPMICYLQKPEGEKEKAARLYRHEEREEWIADVTMSGRVKDAEATTEVRLGIVLVGISEHF